MREWLRGWEVVPRGVARAVLCAFLCGAGIGWWDGVWPLTLTCLTGALVAVLTAKAPPPPPPAAPPPYDDGDYP